MGNKDKEQSALVQSVLALDNYLAELNRVGAKIAAIDMSGEIDSEYIQKLIVRFAECGEGISREVTNLSTRLQEAQSSAQAVADKVASQAEAFKLRRREHEEKIEQFRTLGEKVRDLTVAISRHRPTDRGHLTGEERAALVAKIPEFDGQLTSLINELHALRESAQGSRMRKLERDAESMIQTLQAVRTKMQEL